MHFRNRPQRLYSTAAALLTTISAFAQQPETTDPRPQDYGQNLPSDTGVQSTLPSGAVTGAGQPQGTAPQQDEGAPGGVEQRARDKAAREGSNAPRMMRNGRSQRAPATDPTSPDGKRGELPAWER